MTAGVIFLLVLGSRKLRNIDFKIVKLILVTMNIFQTPTADTSPEKNELELEPNISTILREFYEIFPVKTDRIPVKTTPNPVETASPTTGAHEDDTPLEKS